MRPWRVGKAIGLKVIFAWITTSSLMECCEQPIQSIESEYTVDAGNFDWIGDRQQTAKRLAQRNTAKPIP
jgi:hypothetical protein